MFFIEIIITCIRDESAEDIFVNARKNPSEVMLPIFIVCRKILVFLVLINSLNLPDLRIRHKSSRGKLYVNRFSGLQISTLHDVGGNIISLF